MNNTALQMKTWEESSYKLAIKPDKTRFRIWSDEIQIMNTNQAESLWDYDFLLYRDITQG